MTQTELEIAITEDQNSALLMLTGPDRQWLGGNNPEWLATEICGDALILRIGEMVIGIEADGYTHS